MQLGAVIRLVEEIEKMLIISKEIDVNNIGAMEAMQKWIEEKYSGVVAAVINLYRDSGNARGAGKLYDYVFAELAKAKEEEWRRLKGAIRDARKKVGPK